MANYLQTGNQFNEIQIIDPVRQSILDGLVFGAGKLFPTVVNDASRNLYIKTGQYKTKMKCFLNVDQNTDVYGYSDPVISANGAELITTNFNQNSSNTLGTKIYAYPTIDASGNIIKYNRIFAAPTNPAKGGEAQEDSEYSLILKPDTGYLIALYNRSGGDASNIMYSVRFVQLEDYDN